MQIWQPVFRHGAVSRVNTKSGPNENIEVCVWGGLLGQKTEIPRSAFWGLLETRDERWRGQMSKVIGVRPDKLRLAYQLRLRAWGRSGAKTMPTPLCDDQRLRRLCKMAAAKPTHYYESLALLFFPFLSKEVPSVSDSGAPAIYSECSKQICHFCISRVSMLAYYHRQGCLLS